MPGRGTRPGPALYPQCGGSGGPARHRRERTRSCAECREVQRLYQARYRVQRIVVGPRLVSTLGTQRRIRALARLGWSQNDLAQRLGIPVSRFTKVMGYTECRRELADQVTALYRELLDKPGRNHWARANAERQGWPSPMEWDDPDDPAEQPVSGVVVARDHAEALAFERALRQEVAAARKNESRRNARRMVRQADRMTVAAMAS